MKSKILYLILIGIIITFFFQACSKEDDTVQGNTEQVLTDSLQVYNRNGEIFPIYYIQSNSYSLHEKKLQKAFNQDSIAYTDYKRYGTYYTKKLGTLDNSYNNKAAKTYEVTVKFKDSTYFRDICWIKDTIVISFRKVGNINLFPGVNKIYTTTRLNQPSMKYYDTDYKILKSKFYYNVELDTSSYIDNIAANSIGSVFWLNHKM